MVVEFKIAEESKCLISSITFYDDKLLTIKFTPKYNNKEIVIPFDINDIQKSLVKLEKKLKEELYIITDREYQEIENVLLSNLLDCSTNEEQEENKTVQEKLIELADEKITLLFKDQYNEAFAKIFVKDHFEIISVANTKFARFILMSYYEKYNKWIGSESINNLVSLLQAKAEFGEQQYNLYLRVAEYQGDFYYDLTDDKHRCIKVSKETGTWEVLKELRIPLFRRYNQTSQVIPFIESNSESILSLQQEQQDDGTTPIKKISKENDDKLEEFFSNLTNVKDEKTKLLLKTSIIAYFVPNIPHVILMFYGTWGSAKTTLQKMIKEIVDPAKPSLLTFHSDKNEFLQQIAQNYLATFDNARHIPKWLPDEVCKTVTGIGHSKRTIYTVDDARIYEFKHCLIFNGINLTFYEPDVLDRSIPIELPMIEEKDRRLEKNVLNQFYAMKPAIIAFIFDILAKAMTIYPTIQTKSLPRMADNALWCEAISRAMGYKENKFLDAYDESRKEQNSEIVDSNPLAFVIKKFVESIDSSSAFDMKKDTNDMTILFEGSPLRLLEELGPIARVEGIDTTQKDWPKNRNWLVKRINMAKPTLRQTCGIEIVVDRDSTNSSVIRIEKNMSGISGEHEISPETGNLSPYFDDVSPDDSNLSPAQNTDLSTESTKTGDTGDTGDNLDKMNKESPKQNEIDTRLKETIIDTDSFDNTTTSNLKLYENESKLQKKIKERGLFRKWPGSDTWACPNCTESYDRHYMVDHVCRMNKNKR